MTEPTLSIEGQTPETLSAEDTSSPQGVISIEHADTPDNPPAGYSRLYAKADGWYVLDSLGNESKLLDVLTGAGIYAPISKGVTNGDSHDHSGGDGAQIDYNNLLNAPEGVSFATAAEINTGTETGKAINPDALAGSLHGTKYLVKWLPGEICTGDGYFYIHVPKFASDASEPWEIVDVSAGVEEEGVTNSSTLQLNDGTNDILSIPIYLDSGVKNSWDSATQPVINPSYKSLSGVDELRVDIDTMSTTPPEGLTVVVAIRRP